MKTEATQPRHTQIGAASLMGRIPWSKFGLPAATVVMFVFFSLASPYFFTLGNIQNVLRQGSALAILSFGQAFVILSKGFDLSVGSLVGVTSVVTAQMTLKYGLWMGFLSGVLSAALLGCVNGYVVAWQRVNPFITTLGMLSVARGLALILAGGVAVQGMPPEFRHLASTYWGPIPFPVVIAAVLFVIAYLVLNKMRFGRQVYAVGGNSEVAWLSGINIGRVRFLVYVICGAGAGIGGVILSSRVASGQPLLGSGIELESIAAVILGGVSLFGGQGSLTGVLFGVLFISFLTNGLNLLNVSSYTQLLIVGLALVLAVRLDSLRKGKSVGES